MTTNTARLREIARELNAMADEQERAQMPTRAPAAPTPARPAPRGSGGVLPPFGRCAGQPLDAVSDRDLEWYQSAIEKSIADPSRAQYRARNQALLDEIRAELSRRLP